MTDRGVEIFYGADLDVDDWARRHAAGEVPDRWPYGLDRIGADAFSHHRTAADWGLLARVARKVDGRFDWAARAPRSAAALCWDERTGIPVATTRRGGPVATGIIWLTDQQPSVSPATALTRRALGRCDAVWAQSAPQLEPLRTAWRVSADRLHYIPLGVDETFWTPANAGRTDAAEASGEVLVVGNDRDRDHPLAVRSAALARRQRPDLRLTLVSKQVVEVPGDLGVRLPLLGHRQLVERYRSSSVVAVATRPNLHCSGLTATLEAMACGRPVVATATPGMAEYVQDGVTGLLVPPGDERAMADAILSVFADPGAGADLGRAARAAIESDFNTTVMARRFAALLGR